MRTNVTFGHPAEFVGDEEDGGGILSVRGSQWFAELLIRVPDLELQQDLCQEDWGVVCFIQRNRKRFWIGLSESPWHDDRPWLAHFHHDSFASLQRFLPSGKRELRRLLEDVHNVFVADPTVTDITWYEASEMSKKQPSGFPTPYED